MMESPADPYEQQLLKVFDSYDYDNCGSLDKTGLTQLCHTLQLEEQGSELIKCLLKDPQCSRATFSDFRDALLALLGNMQNKSQNIETTPRKEPDKGSPDREVSPKFVFGSKKYGRRSRPRNDEAVPVLSEQNDMNEINRPPTNLVQRSSSQTEVSNSKKRKTNYKLKRCTSLPGNNDTLNYNIGNGFVATHALNIEPEFILTEDMLKEAWEKLGVGKDGYLNQTELILVCDAIGLQNLAKGVIRQLSNEVSLDYDHRISFQELLEALRQDDTWSEVLNSPVPSEETLGTMHTTDTSFLNHRTYQHVIFGPEGSGFVNSDLVIEMWENAGITSPKELLNELGFSDCEINVSELVAILDKEVKGVSENRRLENRNPYVVLLQATLALYQSEIRCLKNILDQMKAEREKLKFDVFEANNRASLLAQEVDDNHMRMEQSTQNQVKLLEQRHNDILKDVMQQFSSEKEQMALVNLQLEQKIDMLEQETEKLKNDIVLAQKYTSSVEKENQVLSAQLNELQQAKESLTRQIEVLETDKQKYTEMEQEQIKPLLSKLSTLQMENSQLRDRIDEMVTEIEDLTNQVSTMKIKVSSTPTSSNTLDQSMEDSVSIVCEGVGIGNKRRSDYSPSKDTNLFNIVDGSPRLGKVRKFHKTKSDPLDLPFTSGESGFDTEVDCFDSSVSTEIDEVSRLQAKVALLEQLLTRHSIPIPTSSEPEGAASVSCEVDHLKKRVQDLEDVLRETHRSITKIHDPKCANCSSLKYISKKLNSVLTFDEIGEYGSGENRWSTENVKDYVDASTETDEFEFLEKKIKFFEEENRELTNKVSELENCVDLLKNEYERCEDYWANKLDAERQMFSQDQSASNEKVVDLLKKVTEYEQQLSDRDSIDGRLPPIQETYNLEKQFTDLEREFDQYKVLSESEITKRDEEINSLTRQLTDLSVKINEKESNVCETAIQVDEDTREYMRIAEKMENLSNHVTECTNIYSSEAVVSEDNNRFPWNREIQVPVTKSDYPEPQVLSTSSLPVWQTGQPETNGQPMSLNNVPSASSSSTTLDKSTPCRPKRTRKHDKNTSVYKKLNQEKDINKVENKSNKCWKDVEDYKKFNEQTVLVPVTSLHNLNGRLHHLEHRCRHLQMVLKQQHYYTEQTVQYYWQQHKSEKAELQYLLKINQDRLDQQSRICSEQLDKLTKSDMLVKELYVENSYLIATVQRLQQRLDMLAQCNTNSSV